MKFPGVVAVLCVVPSGLVLQIGITSCTFPPWTEMSKKNDYEPAIRTQKEKRLNTDKLQNIIHSAVHKNTVCGLRTKQRLILKRINSEHTITIYKLKMTPVLDGFSKKKGT